MITDFWMLRHADKAGSFIVAAGSKLSADSSQIEYSEGFDEAVQALTTQDLACLVAYLSKVLANRFNPSV